MTISATTVSQLTVVETLVVGTGTANVTHNSLNTTQNKLTATSTPPAQLVADFAATLAAGTATVNLLALTGTNGATLATTGMRVQAVKVQNANANQLAVTAGGSNGYAIVFTVPPQGEALLTSTNLWGLIGASACNLTLTGTGTQVSHWMIVMG